MTSATFAPLYDVREMEKLFQFWFTGSLDGITSKGHTMIGVRNCEHTGRDGLRAQSLLTRYTSADVRAVLQDMIQAGADLLDYVVLLVFRCVGFRTVQDMARAMGRSCYQMQDLLQLAQDEFMRRLLAR